MAEARKVVYDTMPCMKNPKHSQAVQPTAEPDEGESLIQRELELGAFPDERLGKRLERLLGQFVDDTVERHSDFDMTTI